MDNNSYLLIMS